MIRRVALTAWALSLAAVPFACSGSDVTIPADDSDGATTPDVVTIDVTTGSDASTAQDTSTGADTGHADGATDKDAGPTDAATDGRSFDAPDETQPPPYDGGPLNGCSNNYVDRRNGGQNNRTITAIGVVNPMYDLPCMTIQQNQKVQWDMPFNLVPLAPFGGDQPSPIQPVNTGTTTLVQFPNTGTYGFHSPGHANMLGAIKVVN